ncbi:MAG: nitroreductase [Novosphingobium sp.]|nr:nitroreductase [Novosphingobium sp.]
MKAETVSEAVLSRRSIRDFTDRPVPLQVLRRVLDTARWAPSGCNFQPWEATVLTGEPLRSLQATLRAAPPQDPIEYVITPPDIPQEYKDRLAATGAKQYGSMGIARDNVAIREHATASNIVSFGAPVLLLCHIPRVMGLPQWSDVGMWLQTVMLLLREEGLDSCAQEYMAMWGRLIKQHIGIADEEQILFCGLAIGYRDEDNPVNAFERERAPLERQLRFIGFGEEQEA